MSAFNRRAVKKTGRLIALPSILAAAGPADLLCFDFVVDGIKAARMKAIGPQRLITDVFSKDLRALGREEIVAALRDTLAASRKRGEVKVILSIPSQFIITKNIEIPSQDPKEIREIINLQAGRLTPYGREEVIIDYVNIGVFRQSYTKLLLVIVHKDIVNKQLALFAEAGARVDHVFFSCEMIGALVYRHLKLEIQDSPFCLIHADVATTDFGVFMKGRQIFARNISVGVRQVLEEKEKYLPRFIEELKKSLDAYQIEDVESSPTLVVFCGAISALKDLEVLLLDAFRIPARMILTQDLVPRSESLAEDAINPRDVSMVNVCAPPLGFSGGPALNLTPDEVKLRLALEQRGRDIIKTGVLAMTTLLFLCASFLVQIYFKADYLRKLNEKFRALNAEASEIEKDVSKVRVIRKYLVGRGTSLNVLGEIYDLTTPEIALSNLRLRDNGTFSVKGEATSMATVFSYLSDLEKSVFFKEVKTKYTSKKKVDGQELVDFEISGSLEAGAGAET